MGAIMIMFPELALWVRVHTKTLYRWLRDGQLEAFSSVQDYLPQRNRRDRFGGDH